MADLQSDTSETLEMGRVFEGKYRIVDILGKGGYGVVYLAHQETMDRHVALKVLRPTLGEGVSANEDRFLREVRVIANLRHPNTITIHDFGHTDRGHLYMVLEYIEGDPLDVLLEREAPLGL
ncbi:MAG: serine/threonine protein kinase, partial [Bradymonadaceae bacterium]